MVTIVKAFKLQNFDVEWINAVSKIGYLSILYQLDNPSGDFSSMWLLADKVGQFFRNDENCKASAVAFHYYECENHPPRLFVVPRYPGEYQDHNTVYNITESDNQPETSTTEIILPLVQKLMNSLNNE